MKEQGSRHLRTGPVVIGSQGAVFLAKAKRGAIWEICRAGWQCTHHCLKACSNFLSTSPLILGLPPGEQAGLQQQEREHPTA